MTVITALLCCLWLPLISSMSLTFGVDNVNFGALYPVHYQLTDRYSLAQPHGRPGSLQHVDVDHVYSGQDIVDDDKEKRYRQPSSKRSKGGYDNNSYDGGIEDTYNKALHNARDNDIYSAGVRHLKDGFDFGVERRYASALQKAGNSHHRAGFSNLGKKRYDNSKHNDDHDVKGRYDGHNVKERFDDRDLKGRYNDNNVKGRYNDNDVKGRYNDNDVKGRHFSNRKTSSGYDSDTKHSLPIHKKNTAYDKDSNFGHFGSESNFGSGFGKFGSNAYQVTPHDGGSNLSGLKNRHSHFPQQVRNTHNPYRNRFVARNRGNQHRPREDARSYRSSYPPRPIGRSSRNSYRPETSRYLRRSRSQPSDYRGQPKLEHRPNLHKNPVNSYP